MIQFVKMKRFLYESSMLETAAIPLLQWNIYSRLALHFSKTGFYKIFSNKQMLPLSLKKHFLDNFFFFLSFPISLIKLILQRE